MPAPGNRNPKAARLDVRRRKNGSIVYYARVLLGDGSHFPVRVPDAKAYSKERAEEWARHAQEEEDRTGVLLARKQRERGDAVPGESFNDWIERYYKAMLARGVVTAKDIRGRLLNWPGKHFGTKPIASVGRADVEALVRELDAGVIARAKWLARAPGDEAPRTGMSWKTALNIWSDTVRAFDEARAAKDPSLRVLKTSPCDNVRGPDSGVERSKPFLRPIEIAALLACDDVPLYRRVTYAVAIYTAMRQGELRALTPADVDLDAMQIRVSKQARKVSRVRHRTKTGRTRFPQIEPNLVPLLEWLVEHPMGKGGHLLHMPPAEDCADRLRVDLETAGCTREELFADDAQREPISFHKLRHTCGVHMAVRRDAPFDVQWRLGHTNAQMTEGYISEARQAAGSTFGRPLDRLPAALVECLGSATHHATNDDGPEQVPEAVVISRRPQRELKSHFSEARWNLSEDDGSDGLDDLRDEGGNSARPRNVVQRVDEPTPDSDSALRLAITTAVDAGDLARAAALLEVLKSAPKPASVVPLVMRRGGR